MRPRVRRRLEGSEGDLDPAVGDERGHETRVLLAGAQAPEGGEQALVDHRLLDGVDAGRSGHGDFDRGGKAGHAGKVGGRLPDFKGAAPWALADSGQSVPLPVMASAARVPPSSRALPARRRSNA